MGSKFICSAKARKELSSILQILPMSRFELPYRFRIWIQSVCVSLASLKKWIFRYLLWLSHPWCLERFFSEGNQGCQTVARGDDPKLIAYWYTRKIVAGWERVSEYPRGSEMPALISPILSNQGIESHLRCKVRQKLCPILPRTPITFLVSIQLFPK